MKDIKTKPTLKNIKALDKATDVTRRTKDAFVRTKEYAEPQQPKQQNHVEYAADKVKESVETTANKAGGFAQRQGKAVYKRTRREFVNRGYTRSRAR